MWHISAPLKIEHPDIDPKRIIQSAFRISNDLYGNDIASANELAKGHTRPIFYSKPVPLPAEIRNAQDDCIARRKLNKILHLKVIKEKQITVDNLI